VKRGRARGQIVVEDGRWEIGQVRDCHLFCEDFICVVEISSAVSESSDSLLVVLLRRLLTFGGREQLNKYKFEPESMKSTTQYVRMLWSAE